MFMLKRSNQIINSFKNYLSTSINITTNKNQLLTAPILSTEPIKLETRYTHIPRLQEIPNEIIAPVFSSLSVSVKEELSLKKRQHIESYRIHQLDVGSSQIQVAILTERIRAMAAHRALHPKDKFALRAFTRLIQKRRRLLRHLKRNDFEMYKRIVTDFELYADAAEIIASKRPVTYH